MNADETRFEEICPYCNTEQGTTCDCMERIKDECTCADYHRCDYYQYIELEKGDSLQRAIDEWEDRTGLK